MCIFAKTKNIEWDMANTKDYGLREMIYDQCFSTGKEWTGKQLMDIVNKQLVERGMRPFTSRTTSIEDPAEKKAFIAEKEAEYKDLFASPYQAANRGYIDDVIEPRYTRSRIIRAFEMLQTKRLTNPLKKHSNIPL